MFLSFGLDYILPYGRLHATLCVDYIPLLSGLHPRLWRDLDTTVHLSPPKTQKHLFYSPFTEDTEYPFGCSVSFFLAEMERFVRFCVAACGASGVADNQAKPSRQARLSARRAKVAHASVATWRNIARSAKARGFEARKE